MIGDKYALTKLQQQELLTSVLGVFDDVSPWAKELITQAEKTLAKGELSEQQIFLLQGIATHKPQQKNIAPSKKKLRFRRIRKDAF